MRKLSKQEIVDILYGCAILGTGGGGSLQQGLEMVDYFTALGKTVRLIELDEASDDALFCSPYYCGTVSQEPDKALTKRDRLAALPPLSACKTLEKYMGKALHGVLSTELGGANTAVALYAAAMLDKPLLDADPAGRSVPELQQTTFFLKGLPITPLAVATNFGDTIIVQDAADDLRAEKLVRALAVISDNSVGVADHTISAADLRGAIILGAISHAGKIGRAFLEARKQNTDIAASVAKAGRGYELFRGKVKTSTWKDVDGFTVGDATISGTGDYIGNEYHIWFKNENIMAWRNGKVDVTVPDLICVFDDDAKKPLLNPYYEPGGNVSVIGLVSPEAWRTPIGMEVFGPGHFGFDVDYCPIEKRFG